MAAKNMTWCIYAHGGYEELGIVHICAQQLPRTQNGDYLRMEAADVMALCMRVNVNMLAMLATPRPSSDTYVNISNGYHWTANTDTKHRRCRTT